MYIAQDKVGYINRKSPEERLLAMSNSIVDLNRLTKNEFSFDLK